MGGVRGRAVVAEVTVEEREGASPGGGRGLRVVDLGAGLVEEGVLGAVAVQLVLGGGVAQLGLERVDAVGGAPVVVVGEVGEEGATVGRELRG